MSVISLTYTNAFDPNAYAFADPATATKIQSTVDIMTVMATQPGKTVNRANTNVFDDISGNTYNITLLMTSHAPAAAPAAP